MADHIVWFDSYDEVVHRCRVGGKNASLGIMMAAGLPVPPGFALTTEAYDAVRAHPDVAGELEAIVGSLDFADAGGLRAASGRIRSLLHSVPMAAGVESALRDAYAALSDRCGLADVPVAVRSSATAEDLPDASFAGQQDTFLWVVGADALTDKVKLCWSSLFTDRALAYRHQMGYGEQAVSMSVGVQKMVDPKASGVAFTLNPHNGDRSQVAIDASWGLGEAVVAGEVTPDNFLVDKVLREIVTRTISPKLVEYRVGDAAAVEKVDVEAERQNVPCLSDEEVCAVASMARRAEKHYGRPMDIEWALDRHLPAGENVILLQARPETVWSSKPVTPVAGGPADSMTSIVNTLLSPFHARHSGPDQDPQRRS